MQFVAHAEVFERFPGLRLAVAVARGLDNRQDRPAVEAAWRAAWAGAGDAAAYGNAQSHPRIRPWRERFAALGISGKEFPCSAEALLRRALKGGEPFRIDPLVDWYNTISLRHLVPAGAFDLAEIAGPLELRLTRPGDEFVGLDAGGPLAVAAGEVAYADGATVLTRHFVWRQARTGLVGASTRDAFLVSEILGEVDEEVARAVAADFEFGLAEHFGVAAAASLLDARQPTLTW